MSVDLGTQIDALAREDREKRAARLERLYSAWRAVAATDNGQIVLRDLYDFVKPDDPIYHPEAARMAMNEGRREVWLHIQKRLVQAKSVAVETVRTMETLP